MAELRANELESQKKMATSGWAVKKKENHLRNIEVWTATVVVDTKKTKKAGTLKLAETEAAAHGFATVTRAPMKEAETRRLISGRDQTQEESWIMSSTNASIIKYQTGIWW